MENRKSLSRRDFLGLAAGAAAGATLAACAAPTPEVIEKIVEVEVEKEVEVEVEKIVEVEVEKEVEVEVEKEVIVEVEAQDMWNTGMIEPDITGEMYIMSWEDEGEMRKFLLHIDRFFTTYYPAMEYEIEWGVPWGEYWTKLPTLLAAGTPPDLAWQHISRGKVFPHKGWSVNFDPYIEAYPPDGWPDDWWETSVEVLSYEGSVYALPYDWCPNAIWANREVMDSILDYPADDDWTFDDLLQAAIAATNITGDVPVFGLNFSINANSTWKLAKSNGGDIFTEGHTESLLTSPEIVDAAQWLWDLRWKHHVMPTPQDEQLIGMGSEFSFTSGQVAMQRSINDVLFRYNEAIGDKFLWGVYPYPKGSAGRFSYGGNSGWFVPSDSGFPDLGYEMTRYVLSNPDLLPTTGVLGGAFVGRKSFAKWGLPTGDLAEQVYNYGHVFIDLAGQTHTTFPYWAGFSEWNQLWSKWMDPVMVEGDPGIEEALQGLHEETNAFLAARDW